MKSLDTLLPRKVRPDDIIREVRTYLPDPEIELIRRAYVFAMHHHEGQKRYSGHAYIDHPIAVAYILAKMRMDEITIATGILHDTLEDCAAVDKPLIVNLFGQEIGELVDGVTKISQMKFSSQEHKQAENFKKILLATAKDIRVLLVKLADRLHNMYTLEFVPREKRARIARETMEIYSPLAHRLGVQWVRSALEDFSFRYLNPDAYYNLVIKLSKGRKERDKYIEEVIDVLRQLLARNNIQVEIRGRVKSLHSIYKKMQAQKLTFEEVMDIIAFRIVVASVAECYEILGLIHSQWRPVPGRIKDYIAMPKSNMYQSLHTTVIGPKNERMEVQLRTTEMHRIAELGIAAHWRYKAGGGMERDAREFDWLRQIMEWHKESDDPRAFLSGLKMDLFSEEVYVFTPKGDVLNFPKGATPLDFAFRIHTDVGTTTVGAKVNGRIVPLKYELQSGDRVEIQTKNDQKPNRDWLQLVKTGNARAKIRAFLKAEERERSLAAGRQMLEKELHKYKMSLNKVERSGKLGEVAEKLNYRDGESMLAGLGYGKLSMKYILAEIVEPEKLGIEPEESYFDRLLRPLKRRKAGGIKIQGIDDVLFRMAKCCNPVPGEPVIGFVTRGQGISIHRADCQHAQDQPEERQVDVEWDIGGETKSVPTEVVVAVSDHKGVLADITNRLAALEVNIHEVHSTKSPVDDAVELHFVLPIRDISQLQKILAEIRKLTGVLTADRLRH
jgi:GTP diphosphokinase / guanosine-3',5'-bis(diphosphate) 3'-diphosphatase